jgi:galactokinase
MEHRSNLEARVLETFSREFREEATVLGRAPGRVELLGNHTDYNGGLVMAAAVDRFTVVAARPISGTLCHALAVNFGGSTMFDLNQIEAGPSGDWPNYVMGVVWALQEACDSTLSAGFEMSIAGDVPLGAGLSSSASLEAAVALALLEAGIVPGHSGAAYRGEAADSRRLLLAQILQRSENAFVGVASGLLDQFTSVFGRADHAVYLDCLSLEYDRVSLGEPGPAIVVCDSKTSRRLADGMYNQRRAECETVVAFFRERKGPSAVRCLRDVSLEELKEHWPRLDPVGRKRARHVLSENERVQRGVESLRAGNLVEFGRLVSASHLSSRDDFENSSPALDALVEAAESAPGFLGGKLSGAGWAGCTVNLVRPQDAEAFAESVRTDYARHFGIVPEIHICHAAEGALGETIR